MKIGSQILHVVLVLPGESTRLKPSSDCIEESELLKAYLTQLPRELGKLVHPATPLVSSGSSAGSSIFSIDQGAKRTVLDEVKAIAVQPKKVSFDKVVVSNDDDKWQDNVVKNRVFRRRAALPVQEKVDELSHANPSQDRIVKLLNETLYKDLCNCYIAGDDVNTYLWYARFAFKTMMDDFDYVLTGALEKVLEHNDIRLGNKYIADNFFTLLEESFAPVEELDRLKERTIAILEALHDRKIYEVCLPLLKDILTSSTFRADLEDFFKNTLKQEIARNIGKEKAYEADSEPMSPRLKMAIPLTSSSFTAGPSISSMELGPKLAKADEVKDIALERVVFVDIDEGYEADSDSK